ncbi:hypothetical protein H0X48_03300 [Candidatus Dependentiae bacterium]|nr:hypothetical protein [Candidatus Dependentiae bacterium]
MNIPKTIMSISLTLLMPLTQAAVLVPSNARINKIQQELQAEATLSNKVETGVQIAATAAVSAGLFYWLFLRDRTKPADYRAENMAKIIQACPDVFQQFVDAANGANNQPAPAAVNQPSRTWTQSFLGVPGAVKSTIVNMPSTVKNGAASAAKSTAQFVKKDVKSWAIQGGLLMIYKIASGGLFDIANKAYPQLGRILDMYSAHDLRWYIEERTSFKMLNKNIEDYAREYALAPSEEKADVRELLENTVSCLVEDTEKALGFMIFYVKQYFKQAPIRTKALNTKIVHIRDRLIELTSLFNNKTVRTQEDTDRLAVEIVELNKRIYSEVDSFQVITARRALVDPIKIVTPEFDF